MAKFPIDLNATLREEPDKSFTIVVEISGIPRPKPQRAFPIGFGKLSATTST